MKYRSVIIIILITLLTISSLLLLGNVAIATQARQAQHVASGTIPTVDLNGPNAPGINFTTSYTENIGLLSIVDTNTLTVTDTDNILLASATIMLTTRPDGQAERLELDTSGTSLTVDYDAQRGILTLTPEKDLDTLTNFQQALRTIKYINDSEDPNATRRKVEFVVSDGTNTSSPAEATVNMLPINDSPMLDNSEDLHLDPLVEDSPTNDGDTIANILDDSGAPLISDPDGPFSGIGLVEADNSNGKWQYKDGNIWIDVGNVTELTAVLLDSSTRLRFKPNDHFVGDAGLRLRAWDQSDLNSNGSGGIDTSVNGGQTAFSSAILNVHLAIVPENDAPVVDLNGPDAGTKFQAVFTEDGGAIPIVAETALTVTDVDSANLDFAQVTLTNPLDGITETLTATLSLPGIDVTYTPNDGELLLEGPATPGEFQQVLRSVVYDNLSQHPNNSDRTVEFIVNDGISDSIEAISTIAINRVNDAPVLASTQPFTLTAIEEDDIDSIGNLVENIIATGGADPITDVDGDSLEGLAIIGVDNSNGQWQYRLNGSSDWVDFTAVSSISGTLLSPEERIRFVPDPDYVGTASFIFRAWDRSDNNPVGATDINTNINGDTTAFSAEQANATITIIGINDVPVLDLNGETPGREFTADFNEGLGAISIVSPTLTLQDVDNNNILGAQIVITNLLDNGLESLDAADDGMITTNYNPASGTLTLSGTKSKAAYQDILRTITYNNISLAPADNEHRFVVFTVTDASGADSDPITSTVRINPVNNTPVVNSFALTTTEDSPLNFSAGLFTPHFEDPDGDTLTEIKIETLPANGLLKLDNLPVMAGHLIPADQINLLTFEPAENWFGTTAFDWNGKDDEVYPAIGGTVTISVTPENDPPTLTDVEREGEEDLRLWFAAIDFISQFNDIDGDDLATVRIKSLPSRGVLRLGETAVVIDDEIGVNSLSQLSYEPETDWNGIISFDWEASDGDLFSEVVASVVISITAVNDPPTLDTVAKFGSEDNNLPFATDEFTIRFNDMEGNSLQKIMITSLPTHGQLSLNGDPLAVSTEIPADDIGQLSFTPPPNWFGETHFTWNGFDGTTYAASSARVEITITPVNDAPMLDLNGGQSGTSYNASYLGDNSIIPIVSRDLQLTDIDSTNMVSAVISLDDRFDGNAETLDADNSDTAINIDYDIASSTLTLFGLDTIENYQKVLRTVTYHNASTNPTVGNRSVTFIVNDGTSSSDATESHIIPPRQTFLPITPNNMPGQDEPNNHCGQAFPLAGNQLYEFFPNDQEDWYSFVLTTSKDVTVVLTEFAPRGDGQLIVYGGACPGGLGSLGQNGDHSTTKILNLGTQPPGTYYIRVFTSSSSSTTIPYKLRIQY
ncbi:MAG: tandem-95 repeat protein [Chloroflexota bacterium]